MEIPYTSSLRFSVLKPTSHRTKTYINKPTGHFWWTSSYDRLLSFAKISRHQTSLKIVACNKDISIQKRAELASEKPNYEVEAKNLEEKLSKAGNVLLNFMRPFVVQASVIEFLGVLARTWIENRHLVRWSNGSLLMKTVAALVAIICSYAFTSGINQIFDVEIDKINKPYLPLAAGKLSLQSAWLLVLIYVAVGMSAAAIPNSPLFLAFICFQYFLGAAYSVPPFSLKKSTIGAAVLMALGQGLSLVFCLQAGVRATLGLPFQLSWPVMFLAIFTTVFFFGMSFIKDITDVEGDKKYNAKTLATIFGVKTIVFLGSGLLLMNYMGAILAAAYMPQIFRCNIMIPAHIFMAMCLIYQVWKLHKTNYKKDDCLLFYLSCWMLSYAEFMLFPLM